MDRNIIAELAPNGALRAGINMANFLLVSGQAANGDPIGVSPDMAREVAVRLGVPVEFACYKSPGALADAVETREWDIGLIGAEPQREEKIAFTAAYCEIEATYLVPAGSSIGSLADVDKPGIRISVSGRSAYGLWLKRNIVHAEIVDAESMDTAYDNFVSNKLDVLAGLHPRLLSDLEKLPGAKILDGKFSAVQQAIGTPRTNSEGVSWLKDFVEQAKSSGFVRDLIEKYGVNGLSVAPPG